jgi:hypothetical protein
MVVKEVIRDAKVDKHLQKRRAQGIKMLGKIWRNTTPLSDEEMEKYGSGFFSRGPSKNATKSDDGDGNDGEAGKASSSSSSSASSTTTTTTSEQRMHAKLAREHAGYGEGAMTVYNDSTPYVQWYQRVLVVHKTGGTSATTTTSATIVETVQETLEDSSTSTTTTSTTSTSTSATITVVSSEVSDELEQQHE